MFLMTILNVFVIAVSIIMSLFFPFDVNSSIPSVNKSASLNKPANNIPEPSFVVTIPHNTEYSDMKCNEYVWISWNLTGNFSEEMIKQLKSYEVFIVSKDDVSNESEWRQILPPFPLITDEYISDANKHVILQDKIAFYPWTDTHLLLTQPPLVVIVRINIHTPTDQSEKVYNDMLTVELNQNTKPLIGYSDFFTFPNCHIQTSLLY